MWLLSVTFNSSYNLSSEAFHSNKDHALVMWGRQRNKKAKTQFPLFSTCCSIIAFKSFAILVWWEKQTLQILVL